MHQELEKLGAILLQSDSLVAGFGNTGKAAVWVFSAALLKEFRDLK